MARRIDTVVGIDLGTTNSVVAALDSSGRPETIPNRDGDLSTPSVVLFEDDGLVVGKEAQKHALLEPDRVADCAKRDMGSVHYHRLIGGRQVSPQMISAVILKRLKADAEQRIGPISHAVITVPAYFDHSRREATAEAGRLAGLEVVEILNEPTAAALAYGFREGFLDAEGALSRRQTVRKGVLTVIVYDFGGGTFDVTVMQLRDRQFKTLVTDGDSRLGGRDWDRRIIDHAADAYLTEHPGNDPRDDPETLQALFQAAEEAKRSLSSRPKALLVYVHQGHRVKLELTREVFEEITADLLDRTRTTTQLVLQEAGLEWSDVDEVLLSGGSTRMLQVPRMLKELSGKEPDRSLSPDEAVAHGAALYHGILRAAASATADSPPPPTITDVNAHSLGVVALLKSTGLLHNSILIPRNTPLPYSGRQTYRIVRDGQERLVVKVVEGEALDPADCIPLGAFVIEPLPPDLPMGTPVEVRYSYKRGGRIRVEAVIDAPGARGEVRIARRPSSGAQAFDNWVADLMTLPDL
jgi:molecular chaperone DnaK